MIFEESHGIREPSRFTTSRGDGVEFSERLRGEVNFVRSEEGEITEEEESAKDYRRAARPTLIRIKACAK
jgi:hypothetical protein